MTRQISFLLIIGVALLSGIFMFVQPCWAQSFSDLEMAEGQTLENTSTQPEPTTTDTPTTDVATQQFDENLKKVMSPVEYDQFMAARSYSEKNSTYTLGPTDVIDVTVLRHPEVSGKYNLNKEGKIQYEFIGDVLLAGLTKEQAGDLLSSKLSVYIVNPQVTIKISEYNSKLVYVVGEVARPGRIIMRGDTITVREALLEAGLPLLTAKTTNASMFTPIAGNVKIRRVDVDALLYKGDLRQNFTMKPGDTLYVPPTFWAKAMRVINPIAQPVGQAAATTGAVGN